MGMTQLTRTLTTARALADATPADRKRSIDFLRAASILVVVIGHWIMASPEIVDGRVQIGRLLADAPWTQWLTWILQVMPVFFFVGGYANAVAWRSAHGRGVAYAVWLRSRLRRLILPAVPVLLFWVPVAAVALASGLEPSLIKVATQAALVPTWFLATYVLIVMTAPWTLATWDRFRWWAFAAFAFLAGTVDVLALGFGFHDVIWLNYLFVWNAVHMLGYAWADGAIGGIVARLSTAIGGLVALASLVFFGPYPIAMVGLDNVAVTNSNPPKVTLVALGIFQFGLAMIFESRLESWLTRRRPWTAVIAVNGSIMSLYLWHLTVMVAVLAVSLGLGGIGLGLDPDSPLWWFTRPIWVGFLAILTLPVVAVVARFERPQRDRRPAPPVWKPVVAVLALCAGLGLLAKNGLVDSDGFNLTAVALTSVGILAGGLVGSNET